MDIELRSPRIEVPEDSYQCFEQLYELGVTDGLPVIAPSEGLVARFIGASRRSAGEVIAKVPPLMGSATVEKVAVNAVMAGCCPEYMPVLIAAVEASCDPEFNLHGISATTNPVSPLVVVNGPIRHEIAMNCGRGVLGPGNRANATIGRALRLMMLNLGGAIPGEVDKATHGMPGKYTMCFGENEEDSPWEPLSVERSLPQGQSSVTVVGAQGTNNVFVAWKEADSIFRSIGNAMACFANNNFFLGRGQPLVILNVGHAVLLHEQGYSKRAVKEKLFEHAKLPVSLWPPEPSQVQACKTRNVVGDWIYPTQAPDDILIVVAGGPEAYHVTYCANFGDTLAITRPVL